MSSVNPYAPPIARVADDTSQSETQPIKLWSADGRIEWLRYLAYGIAGYLIVALTAALSGLIGGIVQSQAVVVILAGSAFVAYAVFLVLQTIKRCHDMNWSGWWSILSLIPLANMVFGLLLVLIPGSRGGNDFGAPPPPNRTAIAVIVIGVGGLTLIGILAALAIPAYQDYVNRARAAQTR